MWTIYRNRVTPQKKKEKKHEDVCFPLISNDYVKPTAQDLKTNFNAAHRLEERFFSQCLTDYGRLESIIKKKKIQDHQIVPYPRLSVETEYKITAHLKYNVKQWYFKDSSHYSDRKEASLTTETILWEDQVLKISSNVVEPAALLNDAPHILQSLMALENSKNIEERQDKEKALVVNSYNDIIPKLGFSEQKEDCHADLKNSISKNCNRKGQEVQYCSSTIKQLKDKPRHVTRRRFMIYLCGGYRDTAAERTALKENVYPQLYLYCKQRGYDFRMVDLRSGLEDPITDNHDSVQLHIEMLKMCQETEGPNFFLFVGQKHEIQLLPSTISQEEFDAILGIVVRDRKRLSNIQPNREELQQSCNTSRSVGCITLENEGLEEEDNIGGSRLINESYNAFSSFSDENEIQFSRSWADVDQELTLFQTMYLLDENTVPPVYRLLPVSSRQPDVLSCDGQRRKAARKAWHSSCLRLCMVLQRNGPEAIGQAASSRLLRTILDWEVEQGLGAKLPAEDYSHCYKRIITDLLFNLKNEYASQFIDLCKGRAEINKSLYKAQQRFIQTTHKKAKDHGVGGRRVFQASLSTLLKLQHTNIYEMNVSWGKKGLSPKHNRSHQFYIERLCSHFQSTVKAALNRVMQLKQAKDSFDIRRKEALQTRIHEEIGLHLIHETSLTQGFTLREDFLLEVRKALNKSASSQNALLLLGEPGSGKSTILAKVAQLLPTWIPGDLTVLVCFIGLTSDSRNVRLLVQNLCNQLADMYCKNTEVSESLAQLSIELHSLLVLVNADRPLAVVLDGLDELSEEHEADLSWLHTPFPPHVYTILSASTHSTPAHSLQTQAKFSLLTIPPLSSKETEVYLTSRLISDSRRLQETQWRLLLGSCLSCPSPLYLNMAYSESRRWTSFSPPEQSSLQGNLRSLFLNIITRLERKYGENLVRRAMALISLSRFGVTEEELLDLLGYDRKVSQELTQLHNQAPSTSEYLPVPYIILAQLRRDLKCYITEVESDGTWVLRWSHSEFSRVIIQHYLKTEDSQRAVHADFAKYFNCIASNSDIFQPLAWIKEEEGQKSYVFNLRKLHALPYHLIHSGQIKLLLSQCLFSYEFLLNKICGLSIYHVEEDLKAAVIPDKELPDIEVLAQALCLSHVVLLNDPSQLATQLLGRLLHIIAKDKPVAPGDPRRYSYLHSLLAQCKFSSIPVLVPSYSCLLPPGGLTNTFLAGHMSPVKALALGQHHAVTCSMDGWLNLWKLGDTVTLVKTIPRSDCSDSDCAADSLALCMEDRVLVLRRGHSLQVQEVHSGKLLYTEPESLDVPVITSTCDGRLLVVFYDGSHIVKVFDLEASCTLLHSVNITLGCEPVYNTILLSHNSVKDHVLFAYRSGSEAAVFSAKAGSVLVSVKAQHQVASIQAVEMSAEYYLLFCRYPYKRQSGIIHIELFSAASYQYLRSILGCSQDCISQVIINKGGTHIVALCPSPQSAITEIVTWNLKTEDHKHIACVPGLLAAGICSDLRLCVGFCRGERYLRLWNLASRINDQTLTYDIHKVQSDGTQEIIPMDKYPSYVVCRSRRPGIVRVWNIRRAQFRAKPVREEYGLFTSSDVALVRDLKVYILTDCGPASFSDTPTPLYQTLLVYDLLTRSYIRKQYGLFIVPCPQQDYRLLKGELLLGLSETRDHLIMWDMNLGYMKGRIKTNYKTSLLSSCLVEDNQSHIVPSEERTGVVMSWDCPSDGQAARKIRERSKVQTEKEVKQCLEREKYNSIDQYLLSGNEMVVVCSYFAHHLNVFSIVSWEHLHTLEDRWSLLHLHTAAITHSGKYLVIANYSEKKQSPYLTLWDTQHGRVYKRLKNESGICCVAITDDASRIAFGIAQINKLKVWEPFQRKHKTISGYGSLNFSISSQLYITTGGDKAILLAGEVSVWDLDAGTVLSVFTPDSSIKCLNVVDDETCSFHLGFSDTATLISMKLSKQGATKTAKAAYQDQLFDESSSSEEEENEEIR